MPKCDISYILLYLYSEYKLRYATASQANIRSTKKMANSETYILTIKQTDSCLTTDHLSTWNGEKLPDNYITISLPESCTTKYKLQNTEYGGGYFGSSHCDY